MTVATQPAPPLAKPSGTTRWGRDDGRLSISKGAAVADVVFGPPCIRGPDSPRSTLGNLTSQIDAQVGPLNASDWPASGRLHGKQAAQRHGPRGPVAGRGDGQLSVRDARSYHLISRRYDGSCRQSRHLASANQSSHRRHSHGPFSNRSVDRPTQGSVRCIQERLDVEKRDSTCRKSDPVPPNGGRL